MMEHMLEIDYDAAVAFFLDLQQSGCWTGPRNIGRFRDAT